MPTDEDGELEFEPGHPSRRTVLRAGALGLAAWTVPTIRPIPRTAAPGSKPPTTKSSSDSTSSSESTSTSDPASSSVLGSETSQSVESNPTVPGYDPPQVESLDVSGPAKPVDGNPNFTG